MIDTKTATGSTVMAFFAGLGLTIQDWVSLIGLAVATAFTARSYYVGRRDAAEKKAEEQKRTALIEKMAADMDAAKPTASQLKVMEMINKSNGVMSDQLAQVLSK